MPLEGPDLLFLSKRKKFVKSWPWMGGILVAMIVGYAAFLLLTQPLLVNPVHVVEQLKQDAISKDTLMLMAGMLPEAMLMCFVLAAALVAFAFSVLSTEKKYLQMIERMQRAAGDDC